MPFLGDRELPAHRRGLETSGLRLEAMIPVTQVTRFVDLYRVTDMTKNLENRNTRPGSTQSS